MAQSMEDTSYRLVKSEVRDLTPELAQEFRDLDPSPTERELNPARLKHLKTKAEAGQLVSDNVRTIWKDFRQCEKPAGPAHEVSRCGCFAVATPNLWRFRVTRRGADEYGFVRPPSHKASE